MSKVFSLFVKRSFWVSLGLFAALVASVGAYFAVVFFMASERQPGDPTGAQPRTGEPATFAREDYLQDQLPRVSSRPLIGVNYTHTAFPQCHGPTQTAVLDTYQRPGVAADVHRQLFEMRKAGVTSLRTLVWNLTRAAGQGEGTLSSAGGTLRQPWRSNLIRYVREVKRFGFARLNISFSPQSTNSPIHPTYDPAKFGENWRFVKTVRSLVKRHGPRDTRFDLLNEGAPSDYMSTGLKRQLQRYIAGIYGRYVKAFGNRDVTVSVIAPHSAIDRGNRLQNLIDAIRTAKVPQPRWYELHIGFTRPTALYGLRDSDSVLRANGLSQPLVIGETAYDSDGVASAVRRFTTNATRRLGEVTTWYTRSDGGCNVSPPYTAEAYRTRLSVRP